MDAPKPTPSAEYRTIKTIGLSPITWFPITAAFAVACLLPFPVWAGALIVGGATAVVVGFWKGNAERLYHAFKARESFEKQADAAQSERDLFSQLVTHGFEEAAANLAAAIEVGRKIQDTILENPWLETYEYGQTTRTLVEELRTKARGLISENTTAGVPAENGRNKETFQAERKALDETLDNIQQLLQERGTDNQDQSPAEKLRRANEISRRARENARKAIDEQKQ